MDVSEWVSEWVRIYLPMINLWPFEYQQRRPLFFFSFFCFFHNWLFFCLFVCCFFLKLKMYILIHNWLCWQVTDKKHFHPINFQKQDYCWSIPNNEGITSGKKKYDHYQKKPYLLRLQQHSNHICFGKKEKITSLL